MGNAKRPLSVGARVAVAALALPGSIGGWLVVAGGGFHHRPYRRADCTIFVDGPAAFAMAVIFFVMATLAVLVLLQHFRAAVVVRLIGVSAMLVPPMVYVLAR